MIKSNLFFERDISEFEEYKNEWDLKRIESHMSRAFMYGYQILLAMYSRGDDFDKILDFYKKLLLVIPFGWKGNSGYIEMAWMLSMGIMLDVEDSHFNKLVDLVKRDNVDDYLFNFLIRYRKPDWRLHSPSFECERPYKLLKEVIEIVGNDAQKASNQLQKYLEKEWYKGHSDCGWYNAHKNKWNIHFGYWSFESGAIAKILGLDDSILKGQQYYPYDMVHWKD